MAARIFLILFCWGLGGVPANFAATKLDSVTVGYSSFSGACGPLWIAVEDQLGRKHGLDLKAIYAGRVRPQQLLASGEVPFVIATGTGALTSHIPSVALGRCPAGKFRTFIPALTCGGFCSTG